jgi:hypothetical protein
LSSKKSFFGELKELKEPKEAREARDRTVLIT